MADTDPVAAALAEIRADLRTAADGGLLATKAGGYLPAALARHSKDLLKGVEAALTGAGTLDAESARFGKIADDAAPGSAVEYAALAASQAYDRSAGILRAAITAALAGKEAGDARE